MTLKDLHDHLSKMLADGVDPETPVARWTIMGWHLSDDDAVPRTGKASVEMVQGRECWWFEGDTLEGVDTLDGEKRTVLYL